MAYDIQGAWSKEVGANAPLRANCPAGPDGSVAGAVASWTNAGFPAGKLVLGVAAYGRSFHPTVPVVDSSGNITTINPAQSGESIPFGEGENAECGKQRRKLLRKVCRDADVALYIQRTKRRTRAHGLAAAFAELHGQSLQSKGLELGKR